MTCHDLYDMAPQPGAPVVVGVDGSANSLAALRYACRFASLLGSPLVAVYACRRPEEAPAALPRLRSWVDRALEPADPAASANVRTLIRPGAPREVLLQLASAAAMLVLGANGHSADTRLLLGSTALACTYRATCPVLVIPGHARDPERAVAEVGDPWREDRTPALAGPFAPTTGP